MPKNKQNLSGGRRQEVWCAMAAEICYKGETRLSTITVFSTLMAMSYQSAAFLIAPGSLIHGVVHPLLTIQLQLIHSTINYQSDKSLQTRDN